MNIQEAIDHLKTIRYKPGCIFDAAYNRAGKVIFSMKFRQPDSTVPGQGIDVHLSMGWLVEDLAYYKPEMLTQEVKELIERFEIHEMYEWFYVGKKQFFNPHQGD